jgi:MoaA/NifB/PqqE/SkfB family radical SAM enzyme
MGNIRRLPLKRNLRVFRFWLENIIRQQEIHPFYASLKLTSKCHFRCSFCDIWRNPEPDLTTGEMKRVMENIADSSVLMVALEGGEPFMRPDIGELLEYMGSLPLYVLLVTSELDLAAYPMAEYTRFIDFLHISIDEGHRNMQMFEELETYKEWNSLVSVQTVVPKKTIPDLEWKVERCHRAGVNMRSDGVKKLTREPY